MKILVIGAGAVGGYFGTRLALGGHDVTFVARGPHGAAIARDGLVVETPDGRLQIRPRVVSSIDEATGTNAELVIVAVKARDLDAIAEGIAKTLAPEGFALPLLNGLDSEEKLAGRLGRDRVIGGIANIAAEIEAPGKVRARQHGNLVVAPLDPVQMDDVARIAELFTEAKVTCRASRDLARVLWRKLLWNAPFNAVCALTRLTAGGTLEREDTRALVRRAMEEVIAVAGARGIDFPDDVIDATLEGTKKHFANTIPSMLQDVLARRPTEADALQGAVVLAARDAGVPVPVHETLWALVKGLENSFTRQPTGD